MPITGILQPEIIIIDSCLRLRKYTDDCSFALNWYQDEETLLLVDGVTTPYTPEKLLRMYHYLEHKGELYFIEVMSPDVIDFFPIGDVTFCQHDMPIVIGDTAFRHQGIGRKVIDALIHRAKQLGFPYLEVAEIYDYNTGSQKLFTSTGFQIAEKTEKGHRYRLTLSPAAKSDS